MTTNTPQPKQKLSPSWELVRPNFTLVKEHYLPIIYLFFLPGLLSTLSSLLIGTTFNASQPLDFTDKQLVGLSLGLISLIWLFVNAGPSTYFLLRAADGKNDSLGEYYRQGLRYSVRIVLYYLAFGLMILGGLILFIVPGILIFRRYLLTGYALVDKDYKVIEAFKKTAKQPQAVRSAIWGVIGVQLLFIIAASVAQSSIPVIGVILGEIISVATVFLFVLRYREISPRAS